MDRLERTLAAIDAANAPDPVRITVRGRERPKELAHAELATEWLAQLRPDAGEELAIAVRGAHLRRWSIPRNDYPAGRSGYLRWRTALKDVHADGVARIMVEQGYDDTSVARVRDIVRKRGLGRDDDVQVLEDVLCLVFVETQLEELASRMDPDHIVSVVRKTLPKMSAEARSLALDLQLPAAARTVLEQALGGPPPAGPAAVS